MTPLTEPFDASKFEAFFTRSPVLVAPDLLGWRLAHGEVEVEIVETEAYLGQGADEASHAHIGLRPRNRSMFGPVGRSYIYKSYGMHLCFNVVCHAPAEAGAVLVRAGRVSAGRDCAVASRGRSQDLANGPGRLGQALGLTLELDGTSLWDGAVTLRPGSQTDDTDRAVCSGPRVGISKAVDLPYRFWLKNSAEVSKGRPGPASKSPSKVAR